MGIHVAWRDGQRLEAGTLHHWLPPVNKMALAARCRKLDFRRALGMELEHFVVHPKCLTNTV
jgi:hypothetical protein